MRAMLAGIATFAALNAAPAVAADLPIKAPPRAVAAAYDSGVYIWVDGSYQSIRLPTYDLGLRVNATQAALDVFDPRATGYGVAGAIGYMLAPGTLWGSNGRIELGASVVSAKATQTSFGSTAATIGVEFLAGTSGDFFFCPCNTAATLSTDYRAWQVNGKAAGDYRFGTVTITPSVTIFGGEARNNQTFIQTLTTPVILTAIYSVNSSLRWTDWGAKFGLDGRAQLSDWVAVGLSGTVGFASRHTSLSASDVMNDILAPPFSGATSVSSTASNTPVLANAEASLIVKPLPNVALRGFVGLNYDSAVPGIVPAFSAAPTVGSVGPAASIKYQHETSYYAGGGIVWKFADAVIAKY